MSKTNNLGIAMGGPTLLMTDGDIALNIRGFAIQTLEATTFTQIDFDQTPVSPFKEKYILEAAVHASDEFKLIVGSISAVDKLEVGDKIFLNWGGVDMPQGTVQDTQGRATEFKDKSIYFIQAIDSSSYEIKLEETKGAGAITLTDSGTAYGDNTWIAKVSDQDFSHGTFTRTGSANARTHEIIGNVDGNVFKTYDDSGLQVNMIDTTGNDDVSVPAGMTIYVPVTNITVAAGACIVYTKS